MTGPGEDQDLGSGSRVRPTGSGRKLPQGSAQGLLVCGKAGIDVAMHGPPDRHRLSQNPQAPPRQNQPSRPLVVLIDLHLDPAAPRERFEIGG